MEFIIILCFATFITVPSKGNYITNPGFESPTISDTHRTDEPDVPGWDGNFFLVGKNYPTSMSGTQFVDVERGSLRQTLSLPAGGQYILAFEQKAPNTSYSSFQADI